MDENLSQQEKIERDEIEHAFRAMLSHPAGKRVLFWILEQGSIYRDPFAADNNVTNYELGRQAASRRLLAMLDHIDPRAYPRLLMDVADLKAMDREAARVAVETEMGNDDAED